MFDDGLVPAWYDAQYAVMSAHDVPSRFDVQVYDGLVMFALAFGLPAIGIDDAGRIDWDAVVLEFFVPFAFVPVHAHMQH